MTEHRDYADEVLRAIRQIVRRIAEHSRNLSRDAGLTVPQLLCLRAVGELEAAADTDITIARISERVQLGPPTVSRIVDRLERAGLVRRERTSSDRRRVSLILTPAGQHRYRSLPIPLQVQFVERFSKLPEDERSAILSALCEVSAMMEADQLDAAPLLAPGIDVRDDEA